VLHCRLPTRCAEMCLTNNCGARVFILSTILLILPRSDDRATFLLFFKGSNAGMISIFHFSVNVDTLYLYF